MPYIYFIINFIVVVVCFFMGVFFLIYRNYNHVTNKSYKTSLVFLAISYFIFGIINSLTILFDLYDYKPQLIPFEVLLISSFQALLFAFTMIILYNPHYFNFRIIFINIIPLIIFSFIYAALFIFYDDVSFSNIEGLMSNLHNPMVILRVIFLVFYLFQLLYYTVIFIRAEKTYTIAIKNYYSDIEKIHLKWVRIAYFSSLSIGITVLIFQLFPTKSFNIVLSFILALFYYSFAINYLNYNKIFVSIKPAFVIAEKNNIIEITDKKTKWQNLKNNVIENKLYLKQGITLEELSRNLYVARTTLSNMINSEEGVNFNTWINSLRIEEAKKIFLANPDYTIFQVAEHCGFSEQSNFSRQFKNITKKTPSEWKKNNSI